MPRISAAQQAAIIEAQHNDAYRAEREAMASDWTLRFTNALVELVNFGGYTVMKTNTPGVFSFESPDGDNYRVSCNVHDFDRGQNSSVNLSVLRSQRYNLSAIESWVDDHYTAVREAQRIEDLRKSGISKLNDEERKALGL
jgi:hypothetical protein